MTLTKQAAVIAPTPGMVASRRQTGSAAACADDQPVEPRLLVLDARPRGEQGGDRRPHAGQRPRARPAMRAVSRRGVVRGSTRPRGFEQPADLVQQVALDAHQPLACDQKRVLLEARPALEPHHLVPAGLGETGQALGIAAVGLAAALQGTVRGTGIDADDGVAGGEQPVASQSERAPLSSTARARPWAWARAPGRGRPARSRPCRSRAPHLARRRCRAGSRAARRRNRHSSSWSASLLPTEGG